MPLSADRLHDRSPDPPIPKLQFMKTTITLLVAMLATASAAIDPMALYPFDSASSGTTPEFISTGSVAATFGPAGSLANNSRRLGTGSLRIRGLLAGATTPEGDDGAITSNNYDWSAGDTRTIAFWMRTDALTDPLATMISLGNTTTSGARFDIRLQTGATAFNAPPGASGLLRLEVQGGFVECTSTDFSDAGLTFSSLRDGLWHHIAVVVPSATATVHETLFYIDGVPVAHSTQGANQAINTATAPLRIGDSYQDSGRDFNGYLDDVRVYGLALTDQEVQDLYNHGVTNASAIAAFEASPEILPNGSSTQFTWQVSPAATAIAIDRGVGDVTGKTQVDATVSGDGTVTYTLSVTTPSGSETAALDLTLLGPPRLDAAQLTPGGFTFTAKNLVPGAIYQAEYSFTLEAESWSLLGPSFTGPPTATQVLTDGAANPAIDPKVFYRVREVVAE
jgi:hypothetical protein